jgi:zinc and cadmium transporter
MTATLATCCAAVLAASLLGGLLPLATVLTHTRLQVYLSFAAGAMLGAAFFHMLPEAVPPSPRPALAWTAAGLLGLFFLERFFAFHHHEAPSDPDDPRASAPHAHPHDRGHAGGLIAESAPGGKGRALQWKVATFGLAIHSLVGGVALASAAVAGPRRGLWGVLFATLIHKPADSLTIVSLMLRAGTSRFQAHAANLGFALMIPLGAALFFAGIHALGPDAAEPATSAALAFSAGTFLCIALSDLLPELQFHEHDRIILSLALLAGVGLMAVAALGE